MPKSFPKYLKKTRQMCQKTCFAARKMFHVHSKFGKEQICADKFVVDFETLRGCRGVNCRAEELYGMSDEKLAMCYP